MVVQVTEPSQFFTHRVVSCACAAVANKVSAMTMIVFMLTLKDCKNWGKKDTYAITHTGTSISGRKTLSKNLPFVGSNQTQKTPGFIGP